MGNGQGRKLLLVILICGVSVLISACSGSNKSDNPESGNAATKSESDYCTTRNTFSTSVALTGTANTFTARQTFNSGICGAGGITFNSNVTIVGTLNATSKSFLIPHPTKPGMQLRYGSLEGPENGVYIRGKIEGQNKVYFPEYWKALVDFDTITVNLTPYGLNNPHCVVEINQSYMMVSSESGNVHCFYTIYGERKDIPKLNVEY